MVGYSCIAPSVVTVAYVFGAACSVYRDNVAVRVLLEEIYLPDVLSARCRVILIAYRSAVVNDVIFTNKLTGVIIVVTTLSVVGLQPKAGTKSEFLLYSRIHLVLIQHIFSLVVFPLSALEQHYLSTDNSE